MAGASYNGYPWSWRVKILKALEREREQGRTYLRDQCDICGDRAAVLHSEDYSLPYTFSPPQIYSLCRPCHHRIHRRFNEPPEEWAIWLEHIRAGGYGCEFTQLYGSAKRLEWYSIIQDGHSPGLKKIRDRVLPDNIWWECLSLDPETLKAAWARPRTLRPRPSRAEFAGAIERVGLSGVEEFLLRMHTQAPRGSICTQKLSSAFSEVWRERMVSAIYKKLGKRLSQALEWEPDRFRNGNPNWISLLAEGWSPEGRAPELVLVAPLMEMFYQATGPQ